MNQSIKTQSPVAAGERGSGDGGIDTYVIPNSPPIVNQIEPLLKAADVARVLQVSKTEAYRLMHSEIPTVRFGKQTVRVRLSDLQRFIEASIQGGEAWMNSRSK